MIKMMMAMAGLSVALMMTPIATAPAKAGVSIDLNIGGGRVSCGRGRLIVEDYGFRRVRPQDCGGRYYRYFGRRHGDAFVIIFDPRRRRIVDVRRIWY
jgi:hypothetical protein